ncbi:hypothetical protein M901_2908 [Bacteriovorax sp. DB6_IX]|nr:hypothetical protein M901_2908 [Bacteriovorax sp. DB6_IX]
MISLSFILLTQTNSLVAKRWEAIINVIAQPSDTNISIN